MNEPRAKKPSKPVPFDEVVKRLLDTPPPHRKQPKPHKPTKPKN
jgi:hypothetical protein